MVANKALIFKQVPDGPPVPGKDLKVESREFDENAPAPSGGVVLKGLYTSFDPYMRGRMRHADVKSYSPPFTLGEPMTSLSIAKVIKSDNSSFKEGDMVRGMTGIEQYSVLNKEAIEQSGLKQIDNPHGVEDITTFLGSLGMPGLTAYSSLYEIGKPKKGETIFISAASGAVGQIVGQLAKHEGLTVIGSVGSDDKLKYIKETLKFDEGFNYKTEKPADALPRLAPNGIDIYYENVGGDHLDAALTAINPFGRIGMCRWSYHVTKTDM
jgi:NADPH-dependent curcumin reductase CurA